MPFANLPSREKEAFFGLLDEYFKSRPEIFGQAQRGATGPSGAGRFGNDIPAAAIKNAMVANPEATAKVFGAGLRHAASVASSSPASNTASRSAFSSSASTTNNNDDDGAPTSVAGRIAAFRGSNTQSPPAFSGRKFGDVDTSSAKGFISSLKQAGKAPSPTPVAPAAQPAVPRSSGFAPPPGRRGFAPAPAAEAEEDEVEPPPAPPAPPAPPGRKAFTQKEEERGEWAEALYDYDSSEPGDLKIKEGQRVLVTERSSDDWWTGEVDGKSGLFPAAYVQLLTS